MTFSTLPPEICGVICTELRELGGNLALLCRTSRNFSREAQRILYHSVDLRGRKLRAVKSWAHAVTQHTHLAERVHALALQLPPNIDSLDASDTTKIVKALRKCVNLKELRGVHGWMTSGCRFRLQKFENLLYCKDRWDDDFWKEQTQIRVLSLSSALPSFDNQLPELIALGTNTLRDLPARPYNDSRLRLTGIFSALGQYSQTLTTLNVRGHWPHHIPSIPQTLAAIAGSLPALRNLGIVELKKKVYTCSIITTRRLLTPILREKFRKLETFVLQVRNVQRFLNPDGSTHNMAFAPDLERLGADMLDASAIGAEVIPGRELSCVLTRSSGGGAIHAKAGTTLDFEALDMFWNP
ncbi:hypothetical protein B0H14DRAFT_2745849 [Mycena olivaceomarginata]|nr:hypothetical protein B0H14DRAFT_2745849 [Mycena olivaceomarginata]